VDKLFHIFKIGEKEIRELTEQPNEPHKHNYEELIIGVVGELEHFIDFQSQTFQAPFVTFVTKGKVHRIVPRAYDGDCDMWVVRFKSEFIPETTFQLYSYYHGNANLKLDSTRCFTRLITLCEMMREETLRELPNYAIVKQILSLLFTMIEAERKAVEEPSLDYTKTQHISFKNFLAILEENFRRPEGVEFYAEKLFMSARNLNLICQNILEQSVSEIIETRKLIEAKNLLITTDLSIAEIGYDLGYNEKSYFSNVFKKKAGQTPTEFREETRRTLGLQ
jgi:AraC family transcriptional regulator, transcriptional activator of pobA